MSLTKSSTVQKGALIRADWSSTPQWTTICTTVLQKCTHLQTVPNPTFGSVSRRVRVHSNEHPPLMCEMVLDTQVSVGSECPDIKPSRVVVYFSFDISLVIGQIFSLRAVECTRNHYSSRDYLLWAKTCSYCESETALATFFKLPPSFEAQPTY